MMMKTVVVAKILHVALRASWNFNFCFSKKWPEKQWFTFAQPYLALLSL